MVLERFERHAPAGVMARMALEHALPAGWVDAVFEAHRQKQYPRELLFPTVVELTTPVCLGLRPSLHAAARQMAALPVSLALLCDRVRHTEPDVLRTLVRGSAERLAADRHFCTGAVLGGLEQAGACFIVREHAKHPRLAGQGEWQERGRTGTGTVREQAIVVAGVRWRRIELMLDQPTEDGDTTIRLWSNLPAEIGAGRIDGLYRTRWRVEGMFGRLERALHSEVASLGHPRAALLCFAASVPAFNVLALLARCVERAQQPSANEPPLQVSAFHLAQQVRSSYEGLLIAVPPEGWLAWHDADPARLAEQLLRLAQRINPRAVAISKRKPEPKTTKGYVNGKAARAHVATALVLAQSKTIP